MDTAANHYGKFDTWSAERCRVNCGYPGGFRCRGVYILRNKEACPRPRLLPNTLRNLAQTVGETSE